MEDIKIEQFKEKLELLGYSRRCQQDYPEEIARFFHYLREEEGLQSLKEVTPQHITAYHTWLRYTPYKENTLRTAIAVSVRLNIVKTFYRLMYQEKLLDHNYAPFISLPKVKSKLPKHVPSIKDMESLLETANGKSLLGIRDRCILELLYATGLRNRELRNVTLDDYDMTEHTLFVHGKGDKDRIVPVGDWVKDILFDYLSTVRPKLDVKQLPYLFLSKRGRKLHRVNLNDMIRKYVKKAGVTYQVTAHSFRHAVATHLLKSGADIRYVQELLGHTKLSTTQVYTRIEISFLQKAHRKYHPREKRSQRK